jgi:Na+-driven multidrug efflux pump
MPLLINEFLWASGMAILNQCYSTCGLDVVPALNIASTIQNLANVSSIALATAIGILMGQMLGAGNSKEAVKDANRKLLVTALMCGVIFGFFLLGVSWMFPMLYNTTPAIRQLGGDLIRIIAVLMPVNAYVLACYFTLRAGGQALVTFLFDSCFMWVCSVALAFCLSRFADLPIIPLYAICQGVEIIKCFIGTWLLKKDFWIKNLAGG